MSWQKGTNFFGVDVDAIDDGKPASAHLLRLISRNANYLGGSPRNLLVVPICTESGLAGVGAHEMVATSERWRTHSDWPVFKPANVREATLYIEGGAGDTATVYYEVTTSMGVFTSDVVGATSTSIPVLLRAGRTDYLRIRVRVEGGEISPAGYGSPTTGSALNLLYIDGTWRGNGASTLTWDVTPPNFATTGHQMQFYAGGLVWGSYPIVEVVAANEIVLSSSLPRYGRNVGFPNYPDTGTNWRVRQLPLLSITGLALISDEVSP